MRSLLPFLLLFYASTLFAQAPIPIALVDARTTDSPAESQFQNNIKKEILQLLEHRYSVVFNEYYGASDPVQLASYYTEAYAKNDIVIGIGTSASNQAINLISYLKPTIASVILDADLQGLKKTPEGTSGVNNFTYIEPPFNIKRDINLLHRIFPYDHLVVISDEGTIGNTGFMEQLFLQYLDGKNISVSNIFHASDIEQHLNSLGEKKIATYVLPYLGTDSIQIEQTFQALNKNKIPTAALFGETYLAKGALMGYQMNENIRKLPRRIALNVMKILEGQEAGGLPVSIPTFGENLLLNMETARQIEVYPDFDLMAEATLINLENIQTDNHLTLQSAIAQGLQSNLDIRIEQTDVNISETEIGIAKADLLPQLSASTSLSVLDNLSTLTYQGAQGRANWLLSGEISQVVFAEPILANLAIQKMLKKSEEQGLLQKQLDVVIDISTAYMNILFAKSNLNIQQQNVVRNKENYDISQAKETIGYTGASDRYRWETELANANIDLNTAYASLRQAKFRINQLLNRPIDEDVEIEKATLEESMIFLTDSRSEFINNYRQLELFADFLVQYAQKHLPELAQVDLGIAVQKRLQLSRERALYTPSAALSGSANRVLDKYSVPEGLPDVANATTWSLGLGVSYPIFQGNSRRKLIEQSKLNVLQLEDTRKNTQNFLEFQIRSNMETVGASFSRMDLSQTATEAAQKNFQIVQNAYSAGQTNITTLIDAQNNTLLTELNATNAVYTFILDFLNLERSIGYFNFLATTTEKNAFFQEAAQFLNNN